MGTILHGDKSCTQILVLTVTTPCDPSVLSSLNIKSVRVHSISALQAAKPQWTDFNRTSKKMPIFRKKATKIPMATTAHFHSATYWRTSKRFTITSELDLHVFPGGGHHSCPTGEEQLRGRWWRFSKICYCCCLPSGLNVFPYLHHGPTQCWLT